MNRLLIAATVLCGVCVSARAQGILYQLQPGSTLQIEYCLGPCACPPHADIGPLAGTFTLTRVNQNPLFDTYALSGAQWTALMPQGAILVVGAGTYRIGGEVAVTQELNLTLVVADSPIADPHPYTSGVVAIDPANPFPRLGITSQSQVIGCTQYTVHLVAAPLPCQTDCDGSGGLSANDFQCFLNKFAARDPYANCDGSTANPVLTANDFQCYLNRFAIGCNR